MISQLFYEICLQLIRLASGISHTQDLTSSKLRRATMIIASLTVNQAVSFAIPDIYLTVFPFQKWSWAFLLNFSNALFNAIIFVIVQKELRQIICKKFHKISIISVIPLNEPQKTHIAINNPWQCC